MAGGVSFWPPESGGSGSGVTSLNALTGSLTLAAGANITITPSGGNTLTIAAVSPTAGDLTDVGTDGIVITGGSGAVLGAGTSIAQHVADATHNGYLSSTDWVAFNAKQTAGNYITALTGDITAAGPGSAAATLATVNSDIGSFGTASAAPTLTVNAKGLVTAAADTSIQIVESQVTNLVSDLAGKQAAGNYITALTGDGAASGPGSATLTLATVNSDVGSFGGATSVSAITVNAKGLVTAAASTSIQIAESQVTNLVSDLSGKQSTGNYITAITGDLVASGPGSAAGTLATVNSDVGSFTSANITVNAKGLITAASNGSGGSGSYSQLRYTGGNAGIGSTNTAVMKWSTQVGSTIGAALSIVQSAANGDYVLIGVNGKVDISYTFGDSLSTTTFGILIDPTGSTYSNGGAVLTGNIRIMGPSTGEIGVMAVGISGSSNSFQSVSWGGLVVSGAKIYFLVNGGAPGAANSQFTVVHAT